MIQVYPVFILVYFVQVKGRNNTHLGPMVENANPHDLGLLA